MACPICSGDHEAFVANAASVYSEAGCSFSIHRCKKCSHHFTWPEPSEELLSRIYKSTYAYEAHRLIADEKRMRAEALASLILPKADTKQSTALDIGCMHGHLVRALADLGVRASGVELDEGAVAVCQRTGLDVTRGSLEECNISETRRFDVVVLSHVLEHIRDVSSTLRQVQRLLTSFGQIVVVVPNSRARTARLSGRYWGYWQVPIHVHHFNETSMRVLAAQSGMHVTLMRSQGADSLFFLSTVSNLLGLRSEGRLLTSAQRAIIRSTSRILRGWIRFGDEDLVCILKPNQA